MAELIARNSPFGVTLTKRVLNANVDAGSLTQAIELENRGQTLATRGADFLEALNSFRDKRAAAVHRALSGFAAMLTVGHRAPGHRHPHDGRAGRRGRRGRPCGRLGARAVRPLGDDLRRRDDQRARERIGVGTCDRLSGSVAAR